MFMYILLLSDTHDLQAEIALSRIFESKLHRSTSVIPEKSEIHMQPMFIPYDLAADNLELIKQVQLNIPSYN